MVPDKCEQSAHYKTEAVEKEMVKKNRRERLEAARKLLESIIVTPDDEKEKEKKEKKGRKGKKDKKDEDKKDEDKKDEKDEDKKDKKDEDGKNKKRNRSGKKGKEKVKRRVENMKKCYAREMEELKEKELEPREKLATYQNNPELKKELLKKKAEAYSTERRTTETERRFQKGEISIEYCDERSGVVLVTGSLLDAGKTDEGLEAVQKTVKKMIRDGKRRRRNEEGGDQETEEAVMCLEDILKADNGNEEMWAVSTHADLSAGRRRKESIKRICDSIAAENNAWPYIPMTNEQFYIMNRLYWGDIWREKSWRTLDSIDAMMEKVTEFQQHFPSSVTPLVKTLMMSQGASLTTLNRVIDMMQGKGLTVTQEMDSIGRVSKLLLLSVKRR